MSPAAPLLVALLVTAAPLLEQARAARAARDWRAALGLAERGLESGALGPGEVAELERLAGDALAELGRGGEAALRYRALLALEPDAEASPGGSPARATVLAAAREGMRGQALRTDAGAGSMAGTMQLVVDADPAGMVAGARLRCRTPEGREVTREARGAWRIDVPGGVGCTRVVVAAIDARGNELARHVFTAAPAAPGRRPGEVPATRTRPWYRRPGPWAGAAATLGSLGAGLALWSRSTQDELDALNRDSARHEFSRADDLAGRGRATAALANVSFGLGTFCAAAALATLLWPEEALVVLVPAPGGLGLAARF